MSEIIVETISSSSGGWIIKISVRDSGGETTHRVRMSKDYHERLSKGKVSPEDFVRKSFEFLLEKESKESILAEFDMPKIAYYFPEYETEISNRVS